MLLVELVDVITPVGGSGFGISSKTPAELLLAPSEPPLLLPPASPPDSVAAETKPDCEPVPVLPWLATL
jgi:hypothetical protein